MYDPEELTSKPAMVTSLADTEKDSWLELPEKGWMDFDFEFPFVPVLPVHLNNKTHFLMPLHDLPFCQISP